MCEQLQQEVYELRSQLDRALIRIDELLEERRRHEKHWQVTAMVNQKFSTRLKELGERPWAIAADITKAMGRYWDDQPDDE